MPILRLLSLKCVEQEDTWGDDDAYITVNNETVWGPTEMDTDQTRAIGVDRHFLHQAEIRLYEKDDVDANDYLGQRMVSREDLGRGEQPAVFNQDGANYELWFVVLDDPHPMRKSEILSRLSEKHPAIR